MAGALVKLLSKSGKILADYISPKDINKTITSSKAWKKIVNKVDKDTNLRSPQKKQIHNKLKQWADGLLTPDETSGYINNIVNDNYLKKYKLRYKIKGPKEYDPSGYGAVRSESMPETKTIKAYSLEDAKKQLKYDPVYQRNKKYVEDRLPSAFLEGPSTRTIFDEIFEDDEILKISSSLKRIREITAKEKNTGGRVMNDYYKNYNTQRTI